MLKLATIVWGVKEYEASIQFWMAALDYVPKWEPEETWTLLVPKQGHGFQLAVQRVTSDAASHQRHHIDLYAKDQAAEVERLVALGATRVDWHYPEDSDFVVLADPDGNRFCVIEGRGAGPEWGLTP